MFLSTSDGGKVKNVSSSVEHGQPWLWIIFNNELNCL